MAGKVFFSVSMSLDGYIAPDSGGVSVEGFFTPERRDEPPVRRWLEQWMELQ
ncbi:MAG: dihydrofolate reductase, partial [Myxococcales bacterium]